MPVPTTFSITGERLSAAVRVVGFRGREALSQPYRVEVFLLVPEAEAAALDPRALLGRPASLEVHLATGEPRRAVHGAWSSVSLVRAVPGGGVLYRAVLAPRLWRLSLTRRSRVFVGRTLVQIIESMLADAGLARTDYTLQLTDAERRYRPLDHVCQYRETDLDFFSRRLEQAGIYYHFAHPRDGRAERLIITDNRSFAAPAEAGATRFLAAGSSDEGVIALGCEYAAVPTNAQTWGYNPDTPDVAVTGRAVDGAATGVVTSWEPSLDAAECGRVATLRAEALRAQQSVLEGQGRAFKACAGYTLTVQGHSLLDGEYLVTEAVYQGSDATAHRDLAAALKLTTETFDLTFKAIPAAVQFRPMQSTERPKIHGFELGVIKGPMESPYAQVDAQGRYLVKLMFDEDARKPTASARLRMLQPHGGRGGMGFHFPLRNGTEVLVSFLGGDPDAPVIAGVAPNAASPSPVEVGTATKNVIQTGGGSRLEIEDQRDAEAVDWSTPFKNTRLHLGAAAGAQKYEIAQTTEGSGLIDAGGRWDHRVGGDQTETVRGNRSETVGGSHTETITGGRSTHIVGEAMEQFDEAHGTNVNGNRVERVGGFYQQDVTGHSTRNVGGNVTDKIEGTWKITAAYKDEDIANSKRVNSGNDYCVTMGANFACYLGEQLAINVGGKQEINVASKLDVNVVGQHGINLGLGTELNVGVATALSLSGTIETQIGAAVEIMLGPRFGLYVSPTYEAHLGASITTHVGLIVEDKQFEFEASKNKVWQSILSILL
jgi:type VI secretion system secreted protein VgrG